MIDTSSMEKFAEICVYSLFAGPRRAETERSLREALLAETLERAMCGSVFYRERVGPYRNSEDPSAWLKKIPLVTKDDLRSRHAETLCIHEPPAMVSHTSGISGMPLSIYRSASELSFLDEFFKIVFGMLDVWRGGGLRPLIVSTTSAFQHGEILINRHEGHKLLSGLSTQTDDYFIREVIEMLRGKYDIPGVEERPSVLATSAQFLMNLTSFLIQDDGNFDQFVLKYIRTGSSYLPRRWRSILKSMWGAELIDVYSLTEIVGHATSCLECGWLHFQPFVVPEIVDPASREPKEEGVGLLLLTSLYPFVQMQPMIRYRTGDVFESRASLCRRGPSYRFLGKEVNCVWIEGPSGRELLLPQVILYDAVDQLPDAGLYNVSLDFPAGSDAGLGGRPRFHCHVDGGGDRIHLRLRAELRYPPVFYPDRVRAIEETLVQSLGQEWPRFAEAERSGILEVSVELVPPSSLHGFPMKP